MKKIILIVAACIAGIALLIGAGLWFLSSDLFDSMFSAAANRALSFPEKSAPSPDDRFELKQYSKTADGMESLYFYITEKGGNTPLLVSDCKYRLLDFQYLVWGRNTDDVWAVSGDTGTDCYVHNADNTWTKFTVRYGTRSTDAVWTLEQTPDSCDNSRQISRDNIPEEVITYFAK